MNNGETLSVDNKYHFQLLITLLVFITSSCSIEIKDVKLLPKFLSTASAYDVSGKNIVLDNKQLNFGPFTTLEISRGGFGKDSSRLFYVRIGLARLSSFL